MQPKTITAEAYLDVPYNLGLARTGAEELQDKPSAAETDASQTYDYHARTKRFTASLPRDRALAILRRLTRQ